MAKRNKLLGDWKYLAFFIQKKFPFLEKNSSSFHQFIQCQQGLKVFNHVHLIYWSCNRKLDSSQRNNLLSANTRFKGKIRCIFCILSKRREDKRTVVEKTLLSKAVKICPAQSVIKLRFCMYKLHILASRSKASWWRQNCLPTLSSYKWAEVPLAEIAKSCQQNTDLILL